ncbi:hydantoinase B/oxoprolinase family protein, partial [Nodularia spumigena]|uniref:hydantoinase B/oxoprolinase family protein n=1 Tax=Nodularia spumigena TaxID=70799 RepID=UPI002B21EEA2
PARRIDENLADLEAQIASCRTGASLFLALRARHGGSRVERYMGFLQEAAAHTVAEAVSRLPHETHVFSDALDDGSPIVVRITHRPSEPLEIDFTGTAGAHPGNLNAPRAVTVACVLYVLRAWVGRALPLNEGCLRAVSIVI